MRMSMILVIVFLMGLTSCSSSTLPESNTNQSNAVSKDAAIDKSDVKKIEQYYPLHEGVYFKPAYLPEYMNYSEEVKYRYNNMSILVCTFGQKASDIVVYEIEDDAVYEVLRLEDDSKNNKYDYNKAIQLIEKMQRDEIQNFLESIDRTEKRIILKFPLTPGNEWQGGGIVSYDKEDSLKNIPASIKRDISLPEEDIVIAKNGDYYFFFRKDVGLVMVYNPKLNNVEKYVQLSFHEIKPINEAATSLGDNIIEIFS